MVGRTTLYIHLLFFQSATATDPKLDARLDKLHAMRSDAEHPDNSKIQPFRKVTYSRNRL